MIMTQGEWISVADRLPKAYEDVLVYSKGEFFIAYIGYRGWLFYEATSSEEFPVEYWMELPPKPKAE